MNIKNLPSWMCFTGFLLFTETRSWKTLKVDESFTRRFTRVIKHIRKLSTKEFNSHYKQAERRFWYYHWLEMIRSFLLLILWIDLNNTKLLLKSFFFETNIQAFPSFGALTITFISNCKMEISNIFKSFNNINVRKKILSMNALHQIITELLL